MVLKEALDESRPASFTQWWHDRRESRQWYTFWVAVVAFSLVLIFGIIQAVLGAVQVWISYQSWRDGQGSSGPNGARVGEARVTR